VKHLIRFAVGLLPGICFSIVLSRFPKAESEPFLLPMLTGFYSYWFGAALLDGKTWRGIKF